MHTREVKCAEGGRSFFRLPLFDDCTEKARREKEKLAGGGRRRTGQSQTGDQVLVLLLSSKTRGIGAEVSYNGSTYVIWRK